GSYVQERAMRLNGLCAPRTYVMSEPSLPSQRSRRLTRDNWCKDKPSLVRNELQRDLEARFGRLAVLVLRDREPPAAHLGADAVVDLAGEAVGGALGRAAGLVDGQRQGDLAARARILVQVVLVAALEAGHVGVLDLGKHDVGRQRRLVERLLVAHRDATRRALLGDLAAARTLGAVGAVEVGGMAGAGARFAVARGAAGAAADDGLLAALADVGDLLAEVGARAALAHVAFARALLAFTGEQVGHRLRGVFLQRDVVLVAAAAVLG